MYFNEKCLEIVKALSEVNDKYREGLISNEDAERAYKHLLRNINSLIETIRNSNISEEEKSLYISHLVRLKYEIMDKLNELVPSIER